MNWHYIWHFLIWTIACAGLDAQAALPERSTAGHSAKTVAQASKVEASERASALPVFANDMPDNAFLPPTEQPDTLPPGELRPNETTATHADTLRDRTNEKLASLNDSVSRKVGKPKLPRQRFVPNPKRALWLSLVLPGAGQIYNRKYWKLPFIYGGFLGCTYALMWNQQMYRDYSQAYLDIMDDDPRTCSYLEMLPPRYDITGREEQFKKLFKRKKDFYRRYRDLSAFCFVGVYLLSVVDAYVDAQLSEFDISPDLSMSVRPAVMETQGISTGRNTAYGVGCCLTF
ncbi:MAG: DUF5683 domain-containing protein [Bacteroidales bacterium]|nr:DUF5683 domain-containing protein [Bacteroidales bacterium]MDY4557289.1 DUF5683 domain-containing protein [Alloprevotella sp.]